MAKQCCLENWMFAGVRNVRLVQSSSTSPKLMLCWSRNKSNWCFQRSNFLSLVKCLAINNPVSLCFFYIFTSYCQINWSVFVCYKGSKSKYTFLDIHCYSLQFFEAAKAVISPILQCSIVTNKL